MTYGQGAGTRRARRAPPRPAATARAASAAAPLRHLSIRPAPPLRRPRGDVALLVVRRSAPRRSEDQPPLSVTFCAERVDAAPQPWR